MALLWPVLAHVALVFAILMATGAARYRAAKAGEVDVARAAVSNTAWPDAARKVANNLTNQFETPVLFYVLTGIAIYIGATGFDMLLCAWGFVLTRYVHSAIHVTSNHVPLRFLAFLAGVGFLVAMWILLVIRLATGAA